VSVQVCRFRRATFESVHLFRTLVPTKRVHVHSPGDPGEAMGIGCPPQLYSLYRHSTIHPAEGPIGSGCSLARPHHTTPHHVRACKAYLVHAGSTREGPSQRDAHGWGRTTIAFVRGIHPVAAGAVKPPLKGCYVANITPRALTPAIGHSGRVQRFGPGDAPSTNSGPGCGRVLRFRMTGRRVRTCARC
jgi:hypothetical protein